MLLADNTGGADGELQTLPVPDLAILPVDVRGERMSMAHALGLNALLPRVTTPYTLIVDPDVMILQRGWDRDLIAGRLPRGNYTTLALSYDGRTVYFAFAERADGGRGQEVRDDQVPSVERDGAPGLLLFDQAGYGRAILRAPKPLHSQVIRVFKAGSIRPVS